MNCPPEYPFQSYPFLTQPFFTTTAQLPCQPYPSPQHSPLSPQLEQKYYNHHPTTFALDPFLPAPPPPAPIPQEPMSPPPPAFKQEPIPAPSPELAPSATTTAATTTTPPAIKRPRQRGPPTKHSDTTSRYSISQDNDRLYKLREEQRKTWQEIAEVFKKEGRGSLTTNVIRVRFYRLKDKAVVWGDAEVSTCILLSRSGKRGGFERLMGELIRPID